MNKKVGKFKLWQLIAAGIALGAIIYVYSRNKSEANPEETFGGTGTGAYGPIDPDTGIPYAFESGMGGGGAAGGGGFSFAEGLGFINQLKEAGLFPEQNPVTEVIREPETIEVEKEGPEPKTKAEVKKAQMATKAVRQQLHKTQKALHKLQNKATKSEHKTTQKHHTTGGGAHVPQTHHAQAHPGTRSHAAKQHQQSKANNNRSQHQQNHKQKQRQKQRR